jgi:hypothetical protein
LKALRTREPFTSFLERHEGGQTYGCYIDDRIKNDSDAGLLEEVAELARQCLEMIGESRPAMKDVAEKLERLSKVMQHPVGASAT